MSPNPVTTQYTPPMGKTEDGSYSCRFSKPTGPAMKGQNISYLPQISRFYRGIILNNSMEQRPSGEANSHSGSQDIPALSSKFIQGIRILTCVRKVPLSNSDRNTK
jgi:hypothetical protein